MSLYLGAKQKAWIQVVDRLPDWTEYDVGRILLSRDDEVVYLGSSVSYGKWHPLGGLNYITTDMIKWNYDFCNDDAVDAYDIPMEYRDACYLRLIDLGLDSRVTNVGDALNELCSLIFRVSTGDVDLTTVMPKHQWDNTKLRFEMNIGEWGEWVDLGSNTLEVSDLSGENVVDDVRRLIFNDENGFRVDTFDSTSALINLESHFKFITDTSSILTAEAVDTLYLYGSDSIKLDYDEEEKSITFYGTSDKGYNFLNIISPLNYGVTFNEEVLVEGYTMRYGGVDGYAPIVTINGTEVLCSQRDTDSNIYDFSTTVSLDIGENIITVISDNGKILEKNIVFTRQMLPQIILAEFINEYPVVNYSFPFVYHDNQTELKAGDRFDLHIVADQKFCKVEIDDFGACFYQYYNVADTNDTVVTVTIADRGDIPTLRPLKVRVKTISGGEEGWSDWYLTNSTGNVDGVNVVYCNNKQPNIEFRNITYPSGQQALKNSESAVIEILAEDFDEIYYDVNDDLLIDLPSIYSLNKTITRNSGDYNVENENLQVRTYRLANNATTFRSFVVNIANTLPEISISTFVTRLRSGGNCGTLPQTYTITVNSNQKLLNLSSMDASIGTWVDSSFTGNDDGTVWTRDIEIHDNDEKGTGVFDNLLGKNLANKTVNVISSGYEYEVGGFVFRTFYINPFPNRGAYFGTNVTNTAKLQCTNLSTGDTGTLNWEFHNIKENKDDSYTILDSESMMYSENGNYWYNCDSMNASSNTSGLMLIELEEVE